MRKLTATAIILAASFCLVQAQPPTGGTMQSGKPLTWFLPEGEYHFDKSIPTPGDILGYDIGERFIEWSDIEKYMCALEKKTPKVSIKRFGRTYQGRQFIQVYITSESNQANLEQLRQEHLALSDTKSSAKLDIGKMPVVVDVMASIHGNEPSGVNSIPVLAWYLAASTDESVQKMLDSTIVILTPGLNPDGINRFAVWENSRSSTNVWYDALAMEESQGWPSPRSNHYYADCNRDWLSLQHPEGQNGVKMYLEWLPDVVLDMHEQGSTSGFYFSPGDKNRTYKDIPQANQDLTLKIAKNTAATLDKKGILYFSREGYDDFYIGKGAAYGDLLGSVCILHEQAATYGHKRNVPWGVLDFPTTVRTQCSAGASVIESAYKMREELLEYQRTFYINQEKAAAKDPVKAIRFSISNDRGRMFHLLDNLRRHDIEVYRDPKDSEAYIIPMKQKKYFTIKALWDEITHFDDNVFYDVSTWTFPYAYNVKSDRLNELPALGEMVTVPLFPEGVVKGGESKVGYAFEVSEFYAPYMVDELLKKGIRCRAAKKSFTYRYSDSDGNIDKKFQAGTVIVPVGIQTVGSEELFETITKLAIESGVTLWPLKTGTMVEHDLGSRIFTALRQPKVAILAGRGMSISETGEAWMALDRRFNFEHTLVDCASISPSTDLDRYNVIIIANGAPTAEMPKNFHERLSKWVNDGGTLIISRKGRDVALKAGLTDIEFKSAAGIDGVILQTRIKKSDPLFWGFTSDMLPVYKMSAGTYSSQSGSVPMKYTETPYISGYISDKNKEAVAGTAAVITSTAGKGRVIFFADDMNFRSYWYGTQRVFINAVLFGNII